MTTELTNVSLEEAITEKTSENRRKRDSDVLQTEEVDLVCLNSCRFYNETRSQLREKRFFVG